jgi:hypothetical protein
MSTDETQPARPPSPVSPQVPGGAPAEGRPAFQGQYQRSVEPKTVPVERPGQPSFPAPPAPSAAHRDQSPYGRPPAGPYSPAAPGPAGTPGPAAAAEPGWAERPPEYGATAQYDSTQQYGSGQQHGSGQFGPEPGYDGQHGASPSGPGQSTYDPASYGRPGYGPQPPARRRRRRRRPVIMSVLAVVVVLILLVIADRVAKAVAENDIANQIKSADSQINPSVNIPGFPFLTQIIAHDINEIDISASNVPAGPITITSVNAVAKGVHINGSFNGGKVDSVTATVFVGFGSVSSALSAQGQGIAGLSLASAGPDKIKATVTFAGVAAISETGTVTMKGNQVTITFPPGGGGIAGAISSALGSGDALPNLSFTIPKLPAGLQVANFNVTSQGIIVNAVAHNTTLSE